MTNFLYGLIVGLIFANVCVWLMGKRINEAWEAARKWQGRTFALLAVIESSTKDNTLAEFEQTANEIASLPEVEK